MVGILRQAVTDLSWLLSRAYVGKSALKLVGDRHALRQRQRMAVMRCACPDQALSRRKAHELPSDAITGRHLLLDGYNVLTTIEAALAGGVLLGSRDGCLRDMASMHGSFRKVEETVPAGLQLGETLAATGLAECTWYLDKPVSNSSRLKTLILDLARHHGWPWHVQLVASPDRVLIEADSVIASADSAILDRCSRWVNLARHVVTTRIPEAWIIDLSEEEA